MICLLRIFPSKWLWKLRGICRHSISATRSLKVSKRLWLRNNFRNFAGREQLQLHVALSEKLRRHLIKIKIKTKHSKSTPCFKKLSKKKWGLINLFVISWQSSITQVSHHWIQRSLRRWRIKKKSSTMHITSNCNLALNKHRTRIQIIVQQFLLQLQKFVRIHLKIRKKISTRWACFRLETKNKKKRKLI